jgi:hypothetical protein
MGRPLAGPRSVKLTIRSWELTLKPRGSGGVWRRSPGASLSPPGRAFTRLPRIRVGRPSTGAIDGGEDFTSRNWIWPPIYSSFTRARYAGRGGAFGRQITARGSGAEAQVPRYRTEINDWRWAGDDQPVAPAARARPVGPSHHRRSRAGRVRSGGTFPARRRFPRRVTGRGEVPGAGRGLPHHRPRLSRKSRGSDRARSTEARGRPMRFAQSPAKDRDGRHHRTLGGPPGGG